MSAAHRPSLPLTETPLPMTLSTPCRHGTVLATLVTTALLGACATGPKLEERPPVGAVEPIEMPAYTAGTTLRQVSGVDGRDVGWEVVEVDADGTYVGRSVEGCSWTKARDPLMPATSWSGCGKGEWARGERTILSSSGSLWPLAPGNRASWKHRFTSSEGTPSSGTRRCEVEGAHAITTRLGDLDAMKVVCKDPWGTTTSWWTAEHGEVRSWHVHRERGLEYDHELTAVERP